MLFIARNETLNFIFSFSIRKKNAILFISIKCQSNEALFQEDSYQIIIILIMKQERNKIECISES